MAAKWEEEDVVEAGRWMKAAPGARESRVMEAMAVERGEGRACAQLASVDREYRRGAGFGREIRWKIGLFPSVFCVVFLFFFF
jgi:hypothetical protein